MKGLIVAAVIVVSAAAAVVGVRLWLEEPEPVAAAPAQAAPEAAPMAGTTAVAPATPVEVTREQPPEEPAAEPELASEPEQWRPDPKAVESLRRSMEEGDPRAPPIARRETEREMPSEEELADPELYLQYEARQEQKVYASFIQASKKKITDLKAIIERAKAEGSVSAEQLAEGEEKLRRLEEMRDKLLQENPELADPGAADDETGDQPDG